MKILVVDRSPPCNLLQGNALIGQHLFRRLRHHQLTLICPAPAEETPGVRAAVVPAEDISGRDDDVANVESRLFRQNDL